MRHSLFALALLLVTACDPRPGGGHGGGHGGGTGGSGECLLEYNTALVNGDPCCFRSDGANRCDTNVRCNELSGAGCCLIYGTSATAGGGRCCLYEDGSYGDGADECRALLSSR